MYIYIYLCIASRGEISDPIEQLLDSIDYKVSPVSLFYSTVGRILANLRKVMFVDRCRIIRFAGTPIVSDTKYLVPRTWYQILGTKYLVPDT